MKKTPKLLYKIYIVHAWFPTFGRDQTKFVRLDLNRMLMPDPETTILCEVQWESMLWVGIYPWDTLVVDRTKSAKSWNIVVAEIDWGRVVKYLQKDVNGVICLQWANQRNCEFVYPQESVSILGVVVSSFRTYDC